MPVTKVEADAAYGPALAAAAGKLVVVDFFATWCGPCVRISPKFEELSNQFPSAAFIKVDVDKCPDISGAAGVSAMPTFHFLLNGSKVDAMTGGDPSQLEAKVRHWATAAGAQTSAGASDVPKGHLLCNTFVDKKGLECLNEQDRHNLRSLLEGTDHLESDCDGQLLINLPFNTPLKLHSLRIKAPASNGPKNIKLFINTTGALDFDRAESGEAVQTLELTPAHLSGKELLELRFVKFQNVQSLQIFVENNQDGSDVTRVDNISLFGSPITATNMSDFKRVQGKAGEVGH